MPEMSVSVTTIATVIRSFNWHFICVFNYESISSFGIVSGFANENNAQGTQPVRDKNSNCMNWRLATGLKSSCVKSVTNTY